MKLIAAREDIDLPPDVAMEASVGVGSICGELGLEVELRICLPGVPRAQTDLLLEQSRKLCPYSNAIQGNVPVRLVVA